MSELGVVFPQDELGTDPDVIVSYARAIEDLGLTHLVAADHVVGLDPQVHHQEAPFGRPDPYTLDDGFLEPLVLFGFLGAHTNLDLMTAVLGLPQRQPVLVAKQAATLAVLTRGRIRLGLGLGYLEPEFAALGVDFAARGARFEEAITVMRALWSERSVDFDGAYNNVSGVGINPRPPAGAVPLWLGTAGVPATLRRVGRLGDGWLPLRIPGHGFEDDWEIIRRSADDAGRAWEAIGIQGRVQCRDLDVDRTRRQIDRWRTAGATHISIDTEQAGLKGLSWEEHVALVEKLSG